MSKLYYSSSEVSTMLELEPSVLRFWEDQFGQLRIKRNRAGKRMYREKDIELIRTIKQLTRDEGYTIAGARKKLQEYAANRGADKAGRIAEKSDRAAEKAAPDPVKTDPGKQAVTSPDQADPGKQAAPVWHRRHLAAGGTWRSEGPPGRSVLPIRTHPVVAVPLGRNQGFDGLGSCIPRSGNGHDRLPATSVVPVVARPPVGPIVQPHFPRIRFPWRPRGSTSSSVRRRSGGRRSFRRTPPSSRRRDRNSCDRRSGDRRSGDRRPSRHPWSVHRSGPGGAGPAVE